MAKGYKEAIRYGMKDDFGGGKGSHRSVASAQKAANTSQSGEGVTRPKPTPPLQKRSVS